MAALDGQTIGFIGLGLMGRHMARNLLAEGARMVVHNRSRGVVEELAAEGMIAADTPGAVAGQARTVILMLSDTAAVETVLLAEDGLIAGLQPGGLVIDMGTTAVLATRRFAAAVEEKGADYVDAPVSGGTVGAESGSMTIMAGGSDASFARAAPLFDVLGGRVTHVGGIGTGQVAKAANQIIVGLTIGAVAEALKLAERAGADPARVRQALQGGFADSRILELHGQRMIDRDFPLGAKAVTQRKDLFQALELADELDQELPATRLCMELYDRLIAAGHGEIDHAGLIKVLDDD
jgi:3-hydroxyisobutyrate dehydrogenase-like beta-hydroxyacid dehydrogenase